MGHEFSEPQAGKAVAEEFCRHPQWLESGRKADLASQRRSDQAKVEPDQSLLLLHRPLDATLHLLHSLADTTNGGDQQCWNPQFIHCSFQLNSD